MLRFKSLKGKTVDWPYDNRAFNRFKDDIWPLVDRVSGYLSDLEAFFLYETARTLKGATVGMNAPVFGDSHVVEIGSYKGRSAVAIGHGLKANENGNYRLICVDPFLDEKRDPDLAAAFRDNVREGGVSDIVDIMPEFSSEAAKAWPNERGVAMLWIDGNHEYENVRDDFLLWSRHLVPGGVVAFHDWYLIGVREAITRHVFSVDFYQHFSAIGGNLVAAVRVSLPPDSKQRGRKERFYWTLLTGHSSLLVALLCIVREALRRPFGGIRGFFRRGPDIF
jgi:predicted O-methyltransferase YrrM